MTDSSEIPGFYKLPTEERVAIIKKRAGLTDEESGAIADTGGLPLDIADRMIENVIGVMPVPLGVAVNFLINGRDVIVPMGERVKIASLALSTRLR